MPEQAKGPNKLRFCIGIFILALSFLMPVSSVFIVSSSLPAALKTVLVGFVTFGAPELLGLAAIALLGKECFDLIVGKALAILKPFAPSGSVSKKRYELGLIIFMLSFLPSVLIAYIPHMIPENLRLYVSIAADLAFIASLFVLGGDFWDKLRSLFIYEARAQFPENPGSGH